MADVKRFSFRGTLRLVWRWSVLLTVPVAFLFAAWLGAVLSRYEDFGLRHPMMGAETPRLHRIGTMELDHFLRKARLSLPGRESDRTGLKQIHLFLPEGSESELNQNLPHSGREYVQARLLYPDGGVFNVKVKYRGDFWWHWAYYKKSLRIRTKKKRLFEGMRSFNLVAPKFDAQVNNHLAYLLARQMSLLAPRSEMVSLWINGESRGVFLLVEQMEEMTLRYNRRMPGDLYRGELVARDRYRGVTNDLFLYPGLWDKIAINNHYPEDSFAPLEALIAKLSDVRQGKPGDLGEVLDVRVWGGFLAYEVLTQTFHFSRNHNWRLYFDPARNRFEPVIWDPNGWHPQWVPKSGEKAQLDIRTSSFHDAMLADHEFLLARHLAIAKFFSTGGDRQFFQEFDRLVSKLELDLAVDPGLVTGFRHLPPQEARAAIDKLRKTISEVLSSVRREYLAGESSVEYSLGRQSLKKVDVAVKGRRPIGGLRLDFDRALGTAGEVRLGYLLGDQRMEVDLAGAVGVRGHSMTVNMPLAADFVPVQSAGRPPMSKGLKVEPGYYWLGIEGGESGATLLDIYALHADGTAVRAQRVEAIEERGFRGVMTVADPVAARRPWRWRGRKFVDGVLTINNDLIIEPGTDVILGPGASILIEGRLVAEGTGALPIRFGPAESGQEPWGAVVLRGQGSNGSVLRHCDFSGGSGHKTPLSEYSAMLSIHDVRGVSVLDSHFRDNKIVDDMMRAVYSTVEIRDSVFENALFDAVDLDIVEGVVQGCHFKESGNDALDLMASKIVVLDSHMSFAGDKGISVGEGTELFAVNNWLEGNAIGVEGKDGSIAFLFHTTLVSNNVALNAYHKNWRYGEGGTVYLAYSRIDGGGDAATIDKRSRIYLVKSEIDRRSKVAGGVVVSDELSIEGDLPAFAGPYLTRLDRSHRGWLADEN